MTDRVPVDGRSEARLATDPVPGPRVEAHGSVVAVAAEDDRYRNVGERAAQIARAEGRALILYDVEAASPLADPLPTFWSGDGPAERPNGPLDEHALETAGRTAIADQVRQLRASGLETAAWLPSDAGAEALGTYAMELGAEIVVVPTDLRGLDGLKAPLKRAGKETGFTSPRAVLRVIEVEA